MTLTSKNAEFICAYYSLLGPDQYTELILSFKNKKSTTDIMEVSHSPLT